MATNQIRFGVGFDVDKSGLSQLKTDLNNLQKMTLKDFKLIDTTKTEADLNKLKESISIVEKSLTQAYSAKLGSTNIAEFNRLIKESGTDINKLKNQFLSAGNEGATAFRHLSTELLSDNVKLKETNQLLNSMATTLGNTIKWTLASGAINLVTGSIQKAWSYTKNLDSSLNDIMIVTDKSAESMDKFARKANKAASALGASTLDYTKASLIYYQQGLGDKDVQARSDVTVKVANVTKQSASEVSEQLTAIWNGYKVSAQEAEKYIDKVAAVAASTAADLEELSEAMSKVASAANTMGIDIDQLNAQISTIVSVTRQDAAAVGTALKTIFARMGDLEIGGEDEFGVKLGDVSGKLKQVGIDVLDAKGQMRDMGSVIEEVAKKWGTWTREQQEAVAVAVAGKRQYNNLFALFENWDMYKSALEVSQNAEGTLQKQQNTYMESLEAHLQKLSTAGEKFYDALFNSDSSKKVIDFLTAAVDLAGDFVDKIGGLGPVLLGIGSILTRVFSKNIAQSLNTTIENLSARNLNKQQINGAKENLIKLRGDPNSESFNGDERKKKDLQEILNLYDKIYSKSSSLSAEEIKQSLAEIEKISALTDQKEILEDQKELLNSQKNNADNILKDFDIKRTRDEKTGKYIEARDLDITDSSDNEVALESLENMKENLSQVKVNINEIITDEERRVSKINEKINELSVQAGDSSLSEEESSNINEKINKLESSLENTSGVKAMRDVLEDLKAQFAGGSKEAERLQRIIREFNNTAENPKKAIEAMASAQEKANKVISDSQKKIKTTENTLKTYNEENQKTEEKLNEAVLAEERAKKAEEERQAVLARQVKLDGIMTTISSVAQLTTAIMGLVNGIKSISEDEDLKPYEKFLKILLLIIPMLPMVISGIMGLKKGFDAIRVSGKKAGADIAVAGQAASAGWGPFLIIILAVMAAIAAIVVILKVLNKESDLDKAKKNLETINKDVGRLQSILSDAKKSYEDLIKSIEDYESAKTAILDLKTGTEEWYEAINDVNSKVIELMSNFSGLARYITTDENGMLVISSEGKEFLKDEEKKKVANAQQKLYAGYIAKNEAENTVTKEALKEKKLYTETVYTSGGAHIKESGLSDENIESLANAYKENGRIDFNANSLKEIGIKNENLINALVENKDNIQASVLDAVSALNANTQQMDLLRKQSIEAAIREGDEYKNSTNKDTYIEIAKSATDKAYKEGLEKYTLENSHGGSGADDENVKNKVAEAYGVSAEDVEFDNDGTVKFADSTGIEDTNWNVVQQVLANKLANEQAVIDAENIVKAENALSNNSINKGFSAFVGGKSVVNLKSATLNNVNSYDEDASKVWDEIVKNTGFSPEEMQKYYGYATKDAYVQAAKDSQKAMIQDMKNLSTKAASSGLNVSDAWNNFAGTFNESTGKYSNNLINSMTTDQATAVLNSLAQAKKTSGKDAAAMQLSGILSSMTNPEDAANIAKTFQTIDWTNTSSQANFIDALRQQGVEVDTATAQWQNFFNTMEYGIVITKEQIEELGLSQAAWENYRKSFANEKDAWDELTRIKNLTNVIEANTKVIERNQKEVDKLQKLQNSVHGSNIIKNLEQQNKLLETQKTILQNNQTTLNEEIRGKKRVLDNFGIDRNYLYNNDGSINLIGLTENANYIKENLAGGEEAYQQALKYAQEIFDLESDWIELADEISSNYNQVILNNIDIKYKVAIDDRSITNTIHQLQKMANTTKNIEFLTPDTALESFNDAYDTAAKSVSEYESAVNAFFDENLRVEELTEDAYNNLITKANEAGKVAKTDLKTLGEAYTSVIEEINQKYEERLNLIKEINDLLNTQININKLFNINSNSSYYTTIIGKNQLAMNLALDEMKKAKADYDEEVKQFANSTIGEEQINAAKQGMLNAIQAMEELAENSLENIGALLEEQIHNVFVDSLSAGTGIDQTISLEYINENWNYQKKQAEEYYDSVNKAYEISKLESQYRKAANNYAGNVNAQNKLNNALKTEIQVLKDKDKLTKYDLERAQKRYNLLEAQIALEQAQQNATQMKLRRDSKGNYSYEYVADINAVEDAMQKLADAENSLYNFDRAKAKELEDNWLSLYSEMEGKILEIINSPYSDDQKQLRINQIRDQYEQTFESLRAQNADVLKYLAADTGGSVEGLANKWGSIVNSTIQKGMTLNFNSLFDDIQKHIEDARDLTNDVRELLYEPSGGNEKSFVKMLEEDIVALTTNLGDGSQFDKDIEALTEKINSFSSALDALLGADGIFANVSKNLISVNNNIINRKQNAENTTSVYEEEEAGSKNSVVPVSEVPSLNADNNPWHSYSDAASYGYGNIYTDSSSERARAIKYIKDKTGNNDATYQDYLDYMWKGALSGTLQPMDKEKAKEKGVPGFDTGGYTGEWGSEGKLAMLHEKELVLNADDTANILSAVKVIRSLGDFVTNISDIFIGTAQMQAGSINAGKIAASYERGSQQLDQNVTIEANFPNVTDHREIQEAINNLVSLAEQKALEK